MDLKTTKNYLKYTKERNNVKIIYQKNKGLPISNNIALKQANGFYIIRVDADDYLDKNAIKILVNEFDNDEIGMVLGIGILLMEKVRYWELRKDMIFKMM